MTDLPLFVYGTLLTGQSQAHLLADLPRRPATAPGALWSLPAGYPALQPDVAGTVVGELVGPVPAERLALVDLYEGVSEGLFRRILLRARVGAREHPAWTYAMQHPEDRGGRRVPSGQWRPFARR